ncbi:tRNA lysidine(34) synthetase TilS [Rhizobiaceae bacterium BDR2-2]|uniref:tRNA(Ile)-lysidine synthase n=1 Tax=Ectorhizobium quercum TaxID=2965071 RepID=A0AAE3MZW8_9HYPH|nr:tRNA lysidine(34) synthetase TilS [Ectorhizobium quercum]MCX8996765.1 tRNA lysidine(34) synthetase TilS [Ectorhizobium quercum]
MQPLDAAQRFLNRLPRPARILVAISGGSDSTGLLAALHRAARGGHSLCAVTIDHALRPESASEAETVAALCASLGISHATLRWEGAKPESRLSEAARLARYRLLKQAAARFSADLVVTAHTADDQDETVLMRAARSARAENAGLSGMAEAVFYDRSIWIARPFLDVRRRAIRDFLAGEGMGWIDDPTNDDPHYERVRIRRALAAGEATVPDVAFAAQERRRLAVAAAEWLERHAVLRSAVLARIAPEGLDAPPDVLRVALSGLVAMLGGRENGPARNAMNRLLAMIGDGRPGRMTLSRVFVALRRDGLYLMRELRGLPEMTVASGAEGVWDGRFRVANPSAGPLTVVPAPAPDDARVAALFPGMPVSLARRAAQAMPCISGAKHPDEAPFEPRIAACDLFLPLFDLRLANALAGLAGRTPFTEPAFSR